MVLGLIFTTENTLAYFSKSLVTKNQKTNGKSQIDLKSIITEILRNIVAWFHQVANVISVFTDVIYVFP